VPRQCSGYCKRKDFPRAIVGKRLSGLDTRTYAKCRRCEYVVNTVNEHITNFIKQRCPCCNAQYSTDKKYSRSHVRKVPIMERANVIVLNDVANYQLVNSIT
jgi:hypothetical protein